MHALCLERKVPDRERRDKRSTLKLKSKGRHAGMSAAELGYECEKKRKET